MHKQKIGDVVVRDKKQYVFGRLQVNGRIALRMCRL